MPLGPSELSILSQLLDEALDMDAAQVEDWLAALPEEHRPLVPRLRDMLAEHLSDRRGDFMSDGPRLANDAAAESVARQGEMVGPYRLIREIGRGGMGAVWLAERADGSLKRQVALKLPRLAWGAGLAERMARERDIGALLEHPNIARLYDAGVDVHGRPYLALEYVDGQPLDAWCEAKALGIPQRLRLFLQVARAVAYAHGRLVVHRDLKPSNVLVTGDGQTHLLDFGIAKLLHEAGDEGLTQDQGRVLTPHYASPEQIRGEAITVTSDVYSLGALLYELLTGQHPYEPGRKSLAALEDAILEGEPLLASGRARAPATAKQLRGELDAILAKALKRLPGQRYATADALAEDIERHLAGERVLARPDSIGYRVSKALRRHRLGFSAASVMMLTVLAGAGVSLVQARRANEAAQRATAVKEFVVDVFRINERDNPGNAELRQLPAELLLERGARLIGSKFAGQTGLQSELYGVVARILLDLGSTPLAVDYALKHVQALDALGAPQTERAEGTLLVGEALSRSYRIADAEARANAALKLATGTSSLRVRARLLLADLMLNTRRYEGAAAELDRADADLAVEAGLPRSLRARALYLRALMLAGTNQFDLARPLYDRAIESAIAAEGPSSRMASRIRIDLAGELVQKGHVAQALSAYETAFAAMRATGGADDFETALAEASAAALHASVEDDAYEQADSVMARSYETLVRLGSRVPVWMSAEVETMRGCTATRFGRVVEGYAMLSHGTGVLRSVLPEVRQGSCLGFAAMETGRHDEAEKEMSESLDYYARGAGGASPWVAHEYVSLANNRKMRGQLDAAREALDRAPAFAQMSGATKDQAESFALSLKVARASIDLEERHFSGVLQQLAGVADRRYMMNDSGLMRGAALCGLGKPKEAMPLMYAGLHRFERIERYAYSPTLAYWRARIGSCELVAGNNVQARKLARLAREGIDGQSNVSPYYKAPLIALESGLRTVSR